MKENHKGSEIVKAILVLAHTLNKQVVAEGVETSRQLSQLMKLKCEYVQGYYFSKPVTVKEAEILLEKDSSETRPVSRRAFYGMVYSRRLSERGPLARLGAVARIVSGRTVGRGPVYYNRYHLSGFLDPGGRNAYGMEALVECELLIKNGLIVDGTGRDAYNADLAVDNGKITAIITPDQSPVQGLAARRIIEAEG